MAGEEEIEGRGAFLESSDFLSTKLCYKLAISFLKDMLKRKNSFVE